MFRIAWKTAAFGVVLGLISAASGGTIATDINGMAGYQGTETYSYGFGATTLWTTSVDFSVYEPGQFELSYPAASIPAGHYVYAYQVDDIIAGAYGSSYAYVTRFSVGLTGEDSEVGIIASISTSGDVTPSNSSFAPATPPHDTAGWDFNPRVNAGETSEVLYFTSPYEPEWDNSTVSGYLSDTQTVPSPTPEPATIGLLAAGAVMITRRKRK